MATQHLFIPGTSMWCKAKEPDPEYGHYEVDWYVNDEWDKRIQDAGIQLKRRINEKVEVELPDGTTTRVYYKVKRRHEGMINGEVVEWGPPAIKVPAGPPDEIGVIPVADYDGLVGNGSQGYLKLEVYQTKKGTGTRWEGMRIDKLVEFIPDIKNRPLTPDYPF